MPWWPGYSKDTTRHRGKTLPDALESLALTLDLWWHFLYRERRGPDLAAALGLVAQLLLTGWVFAVWKLPQPPTTTSSQEVTPVKQAANKPPKV